MDKGLVLLVILTGALGPCVVIGVVGADMIRAIGNNPTSASRIFLDKLAILIIAEMIGLAVIIGTFIISALQKSV